jgi:hypothetical protein
MSNIVDMGLPHGLPEMLNGTQKLDAWYDARNTYAQDYANRLPTHLSGYYQPPREMTAADLGMSRPFVVGREYLIWKHHETGELLGPSVGPEACRARCVRAIWTTDGWSEVDAPYAFWLGAEG